MTVPQKTIASIIALIIIVGAVGYWLTSAKKEVAKTGPRTVVIVDPGGATYAELFQGFQDALNSVSRPESEAISIVYKNAEGSQEKLKQLVSEAVALNPAFIATVSSPPTLQALEETKESGIPILAVLGDPTKHGYITSLQSSGTNLTGIAQQSIELTPKRFEILKEIVPDVQRVAVFYDTTCGPTKDARPIANATAPKLGLELVEFPLTVPTRDDISKALAGISAKDFDAIMFYPHGTLFSKSDLFLAKAREEKLPIIMPEDRALEAGALASYGPSYYALGKQLARQAEKVLRGVDPRDIPFEQAEDIQFVISLPNAKSLGISIPSFNLENADRVISE